MSMEFQIQTKTSPDAFFTPASKGLLQRKCACGGSSGLDGECEECRKTCLQRRAANGAALTTVPPIVHEVLHSPGQPLDPQTRAFMEPRFGHDFSKVRVHTDEKAVESAQAVDALAYTVGRNVVFGASQYSPETTKGQQLLAHELTHVIQQGEGARLQRQLTFGRENDPTEQEAEAIVAVITSNLASARSLHARGRSGAPAVSAIIQGRPRSTQSTPLTGTSLLNPEIARGAIVEVLARQEEPVRRWFEDNTNSLLLISMAGLVCRVRRNVPEAANLADIEIQNIASEWAARHNHTIPRISAIPESCETGSPTPSASGLPSLGDLLKFKFNLQGVQGEIEIPKSLTLRLPVELSRATSLEFELRGELPTPTASFTVAVDGLFNLRISASAQISYEEETETTAGSLGLQIQTRRTVCMAANPVVLSAEIEEAGRKLDRAASEYSATNDLSTKAEKLADIVDQIATIYEAVRQSMSACSQVPTATFGFGVRTPLSTGEGTSERPSTYIGGTITIPWP